MWDAIQEKSILLSHVGDFWYRCIAESEVPTAHKLSHLTSQCRVLRQLANIEDMLLNGGYFKDNFILVKFTDDDVIWYGKKYATQLQHHVGLLPNGVSGNSRSSELTVRNHELLDTADNKHLAIPQETVAFPTQKEDISLAQNTQTIYGLKVDPDLRVTSILIPKSGKILYEYQDFRSQFGRIQFLQNPHTLFPEMKFIAKSCEYRRHNIYCFQLGVDVYGPTDRIIKYVRHAQSPKTLYLASAQAAGFPVVAETCKILTVAPMGDGVIYYTTHGKYAAPFPHNRLKVGATLEKDTVIGGAEHYKLIFPGTALPKGIRAITLDYILPVKGLTAENKSITSRTEATKLRPQFTGDKQALADYHKWLEVYDGTDYSAIPTSINAISLVRQYLSAGRCIIACVNVHQLPSDMYIRLVNFLRRELPLGSTLALSDMPVQLNETDHT